MFIITLPVFLILGIVLSFLMRKEYKAEAVFMPVNSSGQSGLDMGQIGGLASLAGVELGGSNETDISPALYPNLLLNINFQKKLLDTKFKIEGFQDSISYTYYYDSVYRPSFLSNLIKYTVGLPSLLRNEIFSKNQTEDVAQSIDGGHKGFQKLTWAQKSKIDLLLSQIDIVPNQRNGLVTVTATLEDPIMSAQLVDHIIELLKEELVKYKSLQAEDFFQYIKELHDAKHQEFIEKQSELAQFNDNNLVLATSTAQIQKENLQAEFDLTYSLYSSLSKQLEEAKIELIKVKPLFLDIRPISIPVHATYSKTKIVIYTFSVLTFLMVFYYVLSFYLKPAIDDLKLRLQNI